MRSVKTKGSKLGLKMNNITREIAREIYIAAERLGASVDLLSILGSYGDSLDDEDVLGLLTQHNANLPILNPIN